MMQRHRKPAHAHPCSSTHIHSAHPRQAKHSGLSAHAHAQQTHASMLHTSMTHSAHIEYAAHPQLAPPPALRATHNPEKTALMQLWPGGCTALCRTHQNRCAGLYPDSTPDRPRPGLMAAQHHCCVGIPDPMQRICTHGSLLHYQREARQLYVTAHL